MSRKIVDMEQYVSDRSPHCVEELMCVKCGFRYIGVFPLSAPLKSLECEQCHRRGFIINTGQVFREEDFEC